MSPSHPCKTLTWERQKKNFGNLSKRFVSCWYTGDIKGVNGTYLCWWKIIAVITRTRPPLSTASQKCFFFVCFVLKWGKRSFLKIKKRKKSIKNKNESPVAVPTDPRPNLKRQNIAGFPNWEWKGWEADGYRWPATRERSTGPCSCWREASTCPARQD